MKSLYSLFNTRLLPRRVQRDFISRQVVGKKYETVLDIGGGKSPYRKFIQCEKFISTDVEDRRGTGEVVIADANKTLPFENKSIDLILCTEVLEHLHSPANVFSEMRRIIKDNGTILITAPMVWEHHEEPLDFYRYTQYGLAHLARTAGFTDVSIQQSNGHWYTVIALIVSKLRPTWCMPLVFVLNVMGLMVERIESKKNLPLGIQAVIKA